MKFLYSGRVGRTDPVRAAKALIAEDGALAQYPGPAALVAADGAIVCANAAAREIEALFGAGGPLAAAVADALAGGQARTVALASRDGEDAAIEAAVLPLSKGTHALVLGRALRSAGELAQDERDTLRDALRALQARDSDRAA